jgi:PAS domain S-box-containing protein
MASKKNTPENKLALVPDEQAFRLMFEKDPEIMLLIEPITGVILDANQVAVDFYGYPKTKLCGMLIQEINTLLPEQVAAERQKAVHEERNFFVFPHKLASGEERIVEVYSSPLVLQEKQLLFSIIHDITNHKELDKIMWVRSN